MNVTDLFTNLSLGELSNTSIGMDGAGTISAAGQPRIIRHANDGLLRLFSRFILLEKDVLVEQQEAQTRYLLSSASALSKYTLPATRPTVPTFPSVRKPYILDSAACPFLDDVIKILEVYDSFGRKLVLNDEENRDSVFTPQPKLLQVPRPVPGAALGVKFQAKHPQLTVEDLEQDIDLPEVFDSALTAFIAWRVYSDMNTQEAGAKAQEHQLNFETICNEAVTNDLVNSSISTTNIKFDRRGWR